MIRIVPDKPLHYEKIRYTFDIISDFGFLDDGGCQSDRRC
jgi:hypothetical protein